MKNYLINYATDAFFKSQRLNSLSGIQRGFDAVIQYMREDISQDFYDKNKDILNLPRGAGYWLWKPYFIIRTLSQINEGDMVFYADAGSAFDNNVSPLLNLCAGSDKGIVSFHLAGGHTEGEYTRRHVMQALEMESEDIRVSPQRMASFSIFRKCSESLAFLNEWLDFCCRPDLITDLPSETPDFDEFKDHRHDQSLFSLLLKKHSISSFPDPTQWGLIHKETSERDYFINHHRNNSAALSKISI